MPSRLALVNCREPNIGPWTIAKGNESKVEIFGLGRGELIRLDLGTTDGAIVHINLLTSGLHPWPNFPVERYRVSKTVSGAAMSPTTVRILLNGNHKHE